MFKDAVIGVHAAFEMRSGANGATEARESGFANAQIGAYLNEFGLSANAIGYFTIAGPDEWRFITPDVAQLLDIDVYVQDGLETVTPARIARRRAGSRIPPRGSSRCRSAARIPSIYARPTSSNRASMS